MRAKRPLSLLAAAVTVIALMAVGATLGTGTDKKAPPKTGVIKGKVTSGKTPEAGVWVIAETDDLPTPYRKIVVTDGKGRFVIPELPEAGYDVWVRGYGAARLREDPGHRPAQGVEAARRHRDARSRHAQEDAANYPANYWLSLFKPPANTESLPGGRNQHAWMSDFKLGCELCHQMGSANARGMRGNRAGLDAGLKKAGSMDGAAIGLGRDAVLDALADWGGRIAAGEIPEAPPRPTGIERNLVITQWGWGDLYTYAHDEIATDKRNPRLYPDGKIWGVDLGNDRLLSVDPVDQRGRRAARAHGRRLRHAVGRPGAERLQVARRSRPGRLDPAPGRVREPGEPAQPDAGRHGQGLDDHPDPGRAAARTSPRSASDDPVIANNNHHRQLGYYDTKTKASSS